MLRKHQHLILTGYVKDAPTSSEAICDWLIELVEKIDMKILMGPIATYSDMEGNRGLTGLVVIETSHIAIHVWDEVYPALVELDIFSCKDFDMNDALDMLKRFDLVDFNFRFLDRTDSIKEEKLYTVYLTENLINNKVYVGVHSCYNKDGYLGSGKALNHAIKKYGKENFRKHTLKLFNNKDEAYAYERVVVNSDFVKDSSTYNLTLGGKKSYSDLQEVKDKISQSKTGKKINHKWITKNNENMLIPDEEAQYLVEKEHWQFGRYVSEEAKLKMSASGKGRISHRKDKTLSDDHKQKIQNTMKKHFDDGYIVHNAGKKLYIIDGKKHWA